MALFVIGSWIGVFAVLYISRSTMNKEFNHTAYNYIAGPGLNLALYTYLSHFTFVVIAAKATNGLPLAARMALTYAGA